MLTVANEAICGIDSTNLKSDEISAVLLLYLNFVSALLGDFNIDSKGHDLTDLTPQSSRLPDMRVKISTNPKVGVIWLSDLIQTKDRSIQLQVLKLLINLIASSRAREIIITKNIDIIKRITFSLEREAPNIVKHFHGYIQRFSEMLVFPYEVPASQQNGQQKEKQDEQQDDQQDEEGEKTVSKQSALAMRRNRRARHKALKLTQDQVEAISEGNGAEVAVPARIATLKSFVESEKQYIGVLTRALWMYFKPLYGLPPNPPKELISSSVLRSLFGPMEQITIVCSMFVDILENRLA